MTDSLPCLSVLCLLRNRSHHKKHSFSSSCAHRPFFYHKYLNLGTETVTALISVVKFTLVSIGLTTGTRAVLQGYPAGDDRPFFWSILVALLSRGHTKVLLDEPTFGLRERRLRQAPPWVSTVCKWKQPPSQNTQLRPCRYSPVVSVSPLSVCAREIRIKTFTVDYSKWPADWKKLCKTAGNV